jgi:maleate isomerase
MSVTQVTTQIDKPVRHFDAKMDAGFTDKPVIGLITLSTDCITEYELRQMVPPDRIIIASTRIKTHNPLTVAILREHLGEIESAARLFDPLNVVNVFAYACTSGSAVNSVEALTQGVRCAGSEAPITAPMPGALAAFRTLDVSRVAMLTPYPDEVTFFMRDYLGRSGIEVVSLGSFHFDIDYEMAGISPQSIIESAAALDDPCSQAVFLPCTGLRASTAISVLEQRLGKPVVTAHQAMLWHALKLAGHDIKLPRLGRLFQR